MVAVDVQADRIGPVGIKLENPRWLAASERRALGLDNQPSLQKLSRHVDDGRFGQSGNIRQFAPGDPLAGADLLKDDSLVVIGIDVQRQIGPRGFRRAILVRRAAGLRAKWKAVA